MYQIKHQTFAILRFGIGLINLTRTYGIQTKTMYDFCPKEYPFYVVLRHPLRTMASATSESPWITLLDFH